MAQLVVTQSIEIAAEAAIVRQQFADVAHHADTDVHRGVRFEVIDDDGARCRYRQVSKVGPVRLTQELELDRNDSGPLVNRIVKGQFAGGSITFTVAPDGPARSTVEAVLTARLPGPMRLAAPLMRAQAAKQLAAALLEDKHDLESGRYRAGPGEAR